MATWMVMMEPTTTAMATRAARRPGWASGRARAAMRHTAVVPAMPARSQSHG